MNASGDNTSAFERWRSSTLAPFQHRAFKLFWWASLVSSFGSMIQTVGASWLMATIAPGADQVALVQTAGALPFFLFSLISGARADTHDRRSIMLFSVALMLAASAALALIVLLGHVTPGLLLGMTFLIASGAAAFTPAWQASIGDQVPRALIPSAVMANAVGFNLARSLGPAIGGAIVAAAGAALAFVINAVSYIGMAATLVWWRPERPRNPLPPEPLTSAIAAGVRYVSLSPHLLSILARCTLFAIPVSAVLALMPVVTRDLLGGGALTYGLLLGGFGVGAMLGALLSGPLRQRYSSDTVVRGLSAVSFVALLAIGLSPWVATTMLAHVLAGFVWTLGFASFNIMIQLSSPRWVTGRMLAIYQTTAFAAIALGSWCWGELAAVAGLREAVSAAGCSALVSLAVARWLPISVAHQGSLDPHAAGTMDPPRVDIQPTSGPIAVTIEYQVAAENAAQFGEVINELGRIRRRDGARRWSVCQDIDQPEMWLERFESPTWLDYQRRQTRPTLADREVREQLLRLIQGGRGSVRRFIERPPGAEPLGEAGPIDETSRHP